MLRKCLVRLRIGVSVPFRVPDPRHAHPPRPCLVPSERGSTARSSKGSARCDSPSCPEGSCLREGGADAPARADHVGGWSSGTASWSPVALRYGGARSADALGRPRTLLSRREGGSIGPTGSVVGGQRGGR